MPTLYTALTVGKYADQAAVYGQHSNPLLIKTGDVVEVIINNHDVSIWQSLPRSLLPRNRPH